MLSNPRRKKSKRKGLTKASRARLKASSFVFPRTRRYPINDLYHGQLALQYAQWPNNRKDLKKVKAAVFKKYPSLIKWWNKNHPEDKWTKGKSSSRRAGAGRSRRRIAANPRFNPAGGGLLQWKTEKRPIKGQDAKGGMPAWYFKGGTTGSGIYHWAEATMIDPYFWIIYSFDAGSVGRKLWMVHNTYDAGFEMFFDTLGEAKTWTQRAAALMRSRANQNMHPLVYPDDFSTLKNPRSNPSRRRQSLRTKYRKKHGDNWWKKKAIYARFRKELKR